MKKVVTCAETISWLFKSIKINTSFFDIFGQRYQTSAGFSLSVMWVLMLSLDVCDNKLGKHLKVWKQAISRCRVGQGSCNGHIMLFAASLSGLLMIVNNNAQLIYLCVMFPNNRVVVKNVDLCFHIRDDDVITNV